MDYIYSGSRMIAKVENAIAQYFLRDCLSTRLVLDTSGNVGGRQGHLPFGEDLGESGSQEKHHFASYERDQESGNDYAINRGYAYILGRFMRPDPLEGCFKSPQSLGRYTYARSDSVNRVDPKGLEDAGKIPASDEYLYQCGFFDTCKSTGEKIRDLTVGVMLRRDDLQPGTNSYRGHARVWARQKNLLSDCVKRFEDNGCGPPDLPVGFDIQRAFNEVQRPAPDLGGAHDFVDRGGEVPLAIALTTVSLVAAMAGFMDWLYSIPALNPSGRLVADLPEICPPEECPWAYEP